MSNFDLNKRLAELRGYKVIGVENENRGSALLSNATVFDACTRWDCIMPIAVELGVSLVIDEYCKFATSNAQESYEPMGSDFQEVNFNELSDAKVSLVKCCISVLESRL